ncbi:hypothetical protein SMGES_11290 [Serratia marcescens]|nr:hypothetical protein SMGES_11290 [Serratia marcescens]
MSSIAVHPEPAALPTHGLMSRRSTWLTIAKAINLVNRLNDNFLRIGDILVFCIGNFFSALNPENCQ